MDIITEGNDAIFFVGALYTCKGRQFAVVLELLLTRPGQKVIKIMDYLLINQVDEFLPDLSRSITEI